MARFRAEQIPTLLRDAVVDAAILRYILEKRLVDVQNWQQIYREIREGEKINEMAELAEGIVRLSLEHREMILDRVVQELVAMLPDPPPGKH